MKAATHYFRNTLLTAALAAAGVSAIAADLKVGIILPYPAPSLRKVFLPLKASGKRQVQGRSQRAQDHLHSVRRCLRPQHGSPQCAQADR